MMLLVSGGTKTVRFLAATPEYRPFLGHLIVPNAKNRVEELTVTGLPLACDNGCFSHFDKPAFFGMVADFWRLGPVWVTMPDTVGSAHASLHQFAGWGHALHCFVPDEDFDMADGDFPMAVVAQDGMERSDWETALSQAACLFIGGTDAFKLSDEAARLAAQAKARGLWVHMGRVNSLQRIRYAAEIGCDSVDGSGYSQFPAIHLPPALDYLVQLHEELGLAHTSNVLGQPLPLTDKRREELLGDAPDTSSQWTVWRESAQARTLLAWGTQDEADEAWIEWAERMVRKRDHRKLRPATLDHGVQAVQLPGGKARVVLVPPGVQARHPHAALAEAA